MSGFKSGKYFIRFQPHGVGGMYATRQEMPNLPVKLEARVPGPMKRQSWVAIPGHIEGQWYISAYYPNQEVSIGTEIMSTEDPTGVPAGPVIALYQEIIRSGAGGSGPYEKLQQWIVTPADCVPGVTNTYTIQPVTKAVGMNYYVGVKDNELHIQSFPIDDDTPKPYWQFSPIYEPSDEAAVDEAA